MYRIDWDDFNHGMDLWVAWFGFVCFIFAVGWLLIGNAILYMFMIGVISIIVIWMFIAWIAAIWRVYKHWKKSRGTDE